ncbi:MAG TPA: tetratricopeptide repeat protein [Pyrinomonadaceae bacterium]|nr:tetratricopeptide repeat protein [Pyrinomonadaceae bacterium]
MIESKVIKNPFPGLRPFETDEYRLFFGREGQSDAVLARLQRTRFLAVVGTSGSGKSSLIRAGLMPALRGGMMAGAGSGWRIAVMRPGGDPIGNLAAELAKKDVLPEAGAGLRAEEAEAVIDATLRGGSLGIVDAARQGRLGEHEKLLIIVDQFEELFRFRAAQENTTADEAAAFVKLLLEASQQRVLSIYVVLTMRSDFLGDCAQFQGLPEAINDGQYLIPRMTRDERRFAVTGPVGVTRGKISEPLVNRLLNDVGDNPDQLPILQHALMRTWDHWKKHRRNGEPIGMEHYEAIGTMSDALSRHADEAFNELPDERSRTIAQKLFKALTERGADNREIRRPTRMDALCKIAGASMQEMTTVIDVFRGGGRSFLMPPAGVPLRPDTVVDVSHESLIRNWERLKEWVNDEAQSARIYRRLGEAAVLHREGREGLIQDPALQIAIEWYEKNNPNAAWAHRYHPEFDEAMAYLDQSTRARDAAVAERERQRNAELDRERHDREVAERFAEQQKRVAQRLRRFTFALVVISLVALVTAAVSIFVFTKAVENAELARTSAAEAKLSYEAEQRARQDSEAHRKAAEEAQAVAEKESEHAQEEEKKAKIEGQRAEESAQLAAKREAEARRATEEQKAAADRERKAAEAATAARDEARRSAARLQLDSLSRNGLDSFQRGNFRGALHEFEMTNEMITHEKLDADPSLARLQAWVLANVGASKRRLGKLNESIDAYNQSIAIHEKVSGARSAEMFDALHGLGHTYLEAGNPTKAEELYTRAVNYLVANPDLIDQINETPNLAMIARLYRDIGRYAEAEPYFKKVLANRVAQGNELDAFKEMAQFYAVQNNYEEAEKYLLRAIDIQEKMLFHINEERQLGLSELAETYGDLGEVFSNTDREQKSKHAFQLAQELQNAELSRRYVLAIQRTPSLATANRTELTRRMKDNASHLEQSADLLVKLDRFAAAEHLYLLAIAGRMITNDHTTVAQEKLAMAFLKLGDLYRLHLNKHDEAVKRYRAAAETLSKSANVASPEVSSLYGEANSQLGSLYANEMNNAAEGERVLREALEILSKSPSSEKATWRTLSALEAMYLRQSKFREALEMSKQKLTVMRAFLKRTSISATGLEKWNGDEFTTAFKLYVQSVSELSDDYRAAGDAVNAQSALGSLLDGELRIDEVVDEGVLEEYVTLLVKYREILGGGSSVSPASSASSTAVAAITARLNASNIKRKQIQAVLNSVD